MKKNPTIKDIMTEKPMSVNLDTSISKMIILLEENDFDHFPVLDQFEQLKGIISKTDIYEKVLSLSTTTSGKAYSDKIINNTTVEEIMTSNPISITTDQSFDMVIEVFYRGDFHALPVLEHNQLVGIITCKDILGIINDMQFA